MTDSKRPPRGRPPSINRARITAAGMEMGLRDMTVVGIASRLGVSHMGLYKHVAGLEELRQMVAENIFLRWTFPAPGEAADLPLDRYLMIFAESIWRLVAVHPGIAPYLVREDMITPDMMRKIVQHQEDLADVRDLSFAQARWLLLTVGFHCVAVADTVMPRPKGVHDDTIDPYHIDGIRALVSGAISILPEIKTFPYPVEATRKYTSD